MTTLLPLLGLLLLAFAVNLPLGYLRQNCEKFTFGWYFYVHMSIPAIIYLRVKADISWHMIPLTIGAAIAGQFLGGRFNTRRRNGG
jgi:hypothetical protein